MGRFIATERSSRAPDISVSAADPRSAAGILLLDRSDLDLESRYAPEHIDTVSPSELTQVDTIFLVARRSGQAVGCGAIVPIDHKTAEIKRMFVDLSARRQGVGRVLLEALENAASELKFDVLRLETGDRQPEAVALYVSAGYAPIVSYGEYLADRHSLCFEKRLTSSGI